MMLSEGWRFFSNVKGHIENLTFYHPYQLCLCMWGRVVVEGDALSSEAWVAPRLWVPEVAKGLASSSVSKQATPREQKGAVHPGVPKQAEDMCSPK